MFLSWDKIISQTQFAGFSKQKYHQKIDKKSMEKYQYYKI